MFPDPYPIPTSESSELEEVRGAVERLEVVVHEAASRLQMEMLILREAENLLRMELLNPEEAAHLLKTTPSTVYRLIQRQKLSAVHFGKTVRIRKADLEEFINKSVTLARK